MPEPTRKRERLMKVIRYKRVTSTNDKAKVLAEKGASEWTVVAAEVQTRGRGRFGKKWQSHKGGVWFSIILRPRIPPEGIANLQFFASNGIRKAILGETGLVVQTKWPNDVVVGSGKIAGILVESKSKGRQVTFVIVGIGLNLNQTKSTLPEGATSVYATTHEKFDEMRLVSAILERMREDYATLETPDKILSQWWASCVHRSKNVRVQTGRNSIDGIAKGVDADGALLLEQNGRTMRITEGSLSMWSDQPN